MQGSERRNAISQTDDPRETLRDATSGRGADQSGSQSGSQRGFRSTCPRPFRTALNRGRREECSAKRRRRSRAVAFAVARLRDCSSSPAVSYSRYAIEERRNAKTFLVIFVPGQEIPNSKLLFVECR